jgi:hypothetical protein
MAERARIAGLSMLQFAKGLGASVDHAAAQRTREGATLRDRWLYDEACAWEANEKHRTVCHLASSASYCVALMGMGKAGPPPTPETFGKPIVIQVGALPCGVREPVERGDDDQG